MVVMSMWPSPAAAQLSSRDLPIGGVPIVVGKTVWLTSAAGRVTKGKVLNQTADGIEIGAGEVGTTSFAISEVQRIQEPDSVRNGVVKGALVGLLVGSLVVVGGTGVDLTESLFAGDGDFSRVGEGGDAGFYGSIAIGALLGYAIDKGNAKTVYERGSGGMTIAVSAIVSNAGKGVGVRVRW